jgi:hypothetical protein
MALIDPCLSLSSFDRDQSNVNNHPGDEREVVSNDEEAEPLTPVSMSKALTAPSTPLLASHNPSNTHSMMHSNHTTTTPSTAQLSTLPTVLQSVISYIFTDANGQQRSSLIPPNLHTQQSSLVVSLPSTPTSSSSQLLPSRSHLDSRSLSAPPTHLTFNSQPPLTPSSASLETEFSEVQEEEGDAASSCETLVEGEEEVEEEGEVDHFSTYEPATVPPSDRHCAILDLDETLLHSFFPDKVTPEQFQFMLKKCQDQEDAEAKGLLSPDERRLYKVDVGDGTNVVLMLRPHLRKFLRELFHQYDVAVWSAGGKLYVDAICRVLFPSNGPLKPLFQFCWDDVQIDRTSTFAYTKPLTTISHRFPTYDLSKIFLVDNRQENGIYFPNQLVVAPDYLPRPWEWSSDVELDSWLETEALLHCQRIVEQIQHDHAHKKHKHNSLSMDHSLSDDDEGETGTTFFMEDIDMGVDEDILHLQ